MCHSYYYVKFMGTVQFAMADWFLLCPYFMYIGGNL